MNRISYLLVKKFLGTLTPGERAELDAWVAEDALHKELSERISNPERLDEEYRSERLINTERPARDMERRISGLRRSIILRRIAVAGLFGAIMAGLAVLCVTPGLRETDNENNLAETEVAGIDRIQPGKTGALMSDASGETLELDASDTTLIANNCLSPRPHREPVEERILNLEVGRGEEFSIFLEDSTQVWLNSESRLSFPEKFGPDMRRVSVTGEAYFEVKHEDGRPFIVEARGQNIRVYGTTFNVRGYADEDIVQTTLESGTVAISTVGKESSELYLSPGHQSCYSRADSKVTMKTVNPEIVTGWHRGKIVFEESTLETIMRNLSRWYDFRYEFRDPEVKDVVFMGSVSRYSDFKTIISILEDSGEVKFTIEDDTVVITHK